MAIQLRRRALPYDQINITPMVDLTLVLLIIFIILTTAAIQGIEVALPQASLSPPMQVAKTKAITIRADGALFLDAVPVSRRELETRLAALRAQNTSVPVVIRGDAAVQYQRIIDVIDLCGRLSITQVGLVTAPAGR